MHTENKLLGSLINNAAMKCPVRYMISKKKKKTICVWLYPTMSLSIDQAQLAACKLCAASLLTVFYHCETFRVPIKAPYVGIKGLAFWLDSWLVFESYNQFFTLREYKSSWHWMNIFFCSFLPTKYLWYLKRGTKHVAKAFLNLIWEKLLGPGLELIL